MVSRLRKAALTMVLFALLCVIPLSAQTAQKVENLLNREALSWAEAALFVLEASEKAVFSEPGEAFRFAVERNWLPRKITAADKARLNGLALLLMNAFDLEGGLMYSFTKKAHYAYRELVYKEVIQGKTDPEMPVPGRELIFMINRIFAIKETQGETPAPEVRPAVARAAAPARTDWQKLAQDINTQLEARKVADTRASVTAEGVTISLSNIRFMADSAELEEPEKIKLTEIVRILKGVRERNLLVTGHTAMAGTREEQLGTSQNRARAVADYLIALGVRTLAEISVRGFGAENPIADNSTEEGMALNRRVEITILNTPRL